MNTGRTWRRRARGAWRGVERAFGLVIGVVARAFLRRRGRVPARVSSRAPVVADERTIRRIAEAQSGGMSSSESAARYERGEHAGGLHGKARRTPPDAQIFEFDEPPARTETHRGTRRTMASTRR